MTDLARDVDLAVARRAESGAPGTTEARALARGEGWTVADVICTSGPGDRPFEERHERASISVVVAGAFQYRADGGRELLTPGSLLLGDAGRCFECGHEHRAGDRCLSFSWAPEAFDRLAADAGAPPGERSLRRSRLPPLREISPLVARACAGLAGASEVPWEELAVRLGGSVIEITRALPPGGGPAPAGLEARVARAVARIERHPEDDHSLGALAREAGTSPFHFLRTFERVTGVTPHQYVLRTRLRAAAFRLAATPVKVVDVAYDCGFGDLSNFNRAFRAEFGESPRAFRRRAS